MLRPTFSGFQVARRGINASQKLLDITGQNITNINTDGYTRQRVDLYSIAYSSGNTQYATLYGGIGRGVGDTGASQIRDPFLDIRYRNEVAKVGKQGVMSDALSDLEEILGEISKEGLDSQFSNMIKQLQALSATPSDPVIEGVVKTAASMITQLFNNYSKQLDTVKEQQITYLDNGVNETNRILSQIADLNKQIKEQNIHGDKALELNDKRNVLIDELATYMNIEVKRTSEPIGNGRDVENISIILKDNGKTLVDNDAYVQFEAVEKAPGYCIDLRKDLNGSDPDVCYDNIFENGQLAGYLSFLNNKAEFTDGGYSTTDRGIQYYKGMLDQVAGTFAKMFNEANKLDDGTVKDLFESEGGGPITAGNIKISDAWKNTTESYITNTKIPPAGDDNSAANENILYMISLFEKKTDFDHNYSYVDGSGNTVNNSHRLFSGTIQECMSFTSSTLDLQIKNTNSLYEDYGETLLAIDTSRASISGVSLDEEGINLLTYNKSYSAAARLMTTLDEALNTLINNTGRVGL